MLKRRSIKRLITLQLTDAKEEQDKAQLSEKGDLLATVQEFEI